VHDPLNGSYCLATSLKTPQQGEHCGSKFGGVVEDAGILRTSTMDV
jgi:hypothetical protein